MRDKLSKCYVILIFLFLQEPSNAEELEWPHEFNYEEYTISLYQPQVESIDLNEVNSRSAFALKNSETQQTMYGVVWSHAKLAVDKTTRIAQIEAVEVKDIRLPDDAATTQRKDLIKQIESEFVDGEFWMPLEQLIATIDEINVSQKFVYNNQPPAIIFKQKPTVLIQIDGTPQTQDLSEQISQVVNTTAVIVYHKPSETYYVWGGHHWYFSEQLLADNWVSAEAVPESIVSLQNQLVSTAEEGENDDEKNDAIPDIVVTTEVSELVVTEGGLTYSNIEGTDLLYVSNTDSDLFLDVSNQTYYVLISGRWFTATDVLSKWTLVGANELPADFSEIPENSAKGNVLSSVAGTNQAIDAIHDAQIPQTAEIDRKTATADVQYDGSAKFEPVEDTNLSYAINTNQSVFKSNRDYYLCEDGVWYRSKSADGPWVASESRPPEIDSVPPTNPNYHTKYVYIYDVRPTTIVTGYTQGYLGGYFDGFTMVYGTGYNHSSWYGDYYYSRPATYGFSVRYNPWYGWSVGFNLNFGSPFDWFSRSWWWSSNYRPHYHHHHGGWGYHPGHHGGSGGWGYNPGNGGWGYNPGNGGWGHNPGNGGSGYNPGNDNGSGFNSGHGGSGFHPGNGDSGYVNRIYANKDGVKPFIKPATRPKTKPSPGSNVRPTPQPSVRPSPRPSVKPATKPSVKPTPRPGVKPATKPSIKPTPRPSVKPTPKPNVKPNPKPYFRPAPTPNNRAEASKTKDNWLHSTHSRPFGFSSAHKQPSQFNSNNHVYADKAGQVHRKTSDGWQRYTHSGWQGQYRVPSGVKKSHQQRTRSSVKKQQFKNSRASMR